MLKKNQVDIIQRLDMSEVNALRIITMYKEGVPYGVIAQLVGEKLDDVNYVIKNWNKTSFEFDDVLKRQKFIVNKMLNVCI